MWEVDNYTYNLLAVTFILLFWAWFFHLYFKYQKIKEEKQKREDWEMYEEMYGGMGL